MLKAGRSLGAASSVVARLSLEGGLVMVEEVGGAALAAVVGWRR